MRGEERQIAFGMLEDMPWAEDDGERWDYKDWGAQKDVVPGSILRLEGVSVNEYQGKKASTLIKIRELLSSRKVIINV